MSVVVWVPRDAGSLAVGAEATAVAIAMAARQAGLDVELRRNGSRGAYWLESLVEVETPQGRVGYGPVQAADVPSLVAAGAFGAVRSGSASATPHLPSPHALALGRLDALPWFAGQQRLTCARVGLVDPLSIEDYRAAGGYAGLEQALGMSSDAIVTAVTDSGLRGRGGAAFPTGVKWRTVLDQAASQKYIACNADEGDSGTFADRVLMEGDPYSLIEGMTIAGLAVGATQGYIYLRIEYPHAYRTLLAAIAKARETGYLGRSVRGSDRAFDIEVRLGAGAYICGEETSMLESLEGRRGEVRVRPPMPAVKGLFGMPTAVNNVVTLATVPLILAKGADFYRNFGSGKSRGTIPLQLAGNVKRGGLLERAFGLTVRELVYDYGNGTASGRPVRAVQIGGPLGAYLPEAQFDVAIDYEALTAVGGLLGHGGVVVFDDTVDMAAMARFAFEFCAHESCGKCTPCRIGSTRGAELIDRIRQGGNRSADLALLDELCETLVQGSLCGLGGMTPYPVRSALAYFGEDFHRQPKEI